jgi:hypothetical protein
MKAFSLFSLFVCLAISDAIILDCTYQVQTLWMIQNIYVCSARVIVVGDLRNVTDVSQNHVTGMSNDDVRGIVVESQTLRFLPRNIDAFFPNLEALDVYRSQIQEVSQQDFENFLNLRQVNLVGNAIQVIQANLFEKNPLVSSISFSSNPIRHVDYKAFERLENLNTLAFQDTTCISRQHWSDRPGVLNLMFLLLVNCPPSFEMTEARLLNSSEFERSIDEQVAERMNPLTWNIFEMDQRLQDHEERIAELEGEVKRVNELLAQFLSSK